MKMIAAEFQLTSDDYAEAQVAHLTKVLGKTLILAMFVLGAAPVATLFITLTDPATSPQTFSAWIFLGAMLLLGMLLRSKGFLPNAIQ